MATSVMCDSAIEWVRRYVWFRTGCTLPDEPTTVGKEVMTQTQADELYALKKKVNADRQAFAAFLFASPMVKLLADLRTPIQRAMTVVLASSWMVEKTYQKTAVRCIITGETNKDGSISVLDFPATADATKTTKEISIAVSTPFLACFKLLFWWSTWPSMLEVICDDLEASRCMWPQAKQRTEVVVFERRLRDVHRVLKSLFGLDVCLSVPIRFLLNKFTPDF